MPAKRYKTIFSTITDHELLDVSGSDAMLLQGAHEQRTKLLLLLLHRDAMLDQADIYEYSQISYNRISLSFTFTY